MNPYRTALPATAFLILAFFAGPASAQCTIDFEGTCPDATPECGATFVGGASCQSIGIPNCYHTGSFSYRMNQAEPVTIELEEPIGDIVVYFVHQSSGTLGTMRFFDAATGGNEVGTPITTNGDCLSILPERQDRSFDVGVHRIEVTVSGLGSVWIDTMTLTEFSVPVLPARWGTVKAMYGF